jgi:hypothetical protein
MRRQRQVGGSNVDGFVALCGSLASEDALLLLLPLLGGPCIHVLLYCCPPPICSRAGFALPPALPWAGVVALLALPGFAVKQVVNVIQLRTAAQQLVLHDRQQDAKRSRQA